MTERINIRVSETVGQDNLVEFLRSRFPNLVRPVGEDAEKIIAPTSRVRTGTRCTA